MSTTSLTAAEVMDRSAALLNDPAKTDFTYQAQLVYLNMAIDELVESLEESNSSPTSQLANTNIIMEVGDFAIFWTESGRTPTYPPDLVEVQEVADRLAGTNDSFVRIPRREFVEPSPPANSFLYWAWGHQIIAFNPNGALTRREIQLKYVVQAITQALDETSVIGVINARSYLSYKTAAFCAAFIGENTERAQILNDQAEKALERLTGINNKGKQQIMTRHRPFRASYKSRGGF